MPSDQLASHAVDIPDGSDRVNAGQSTAQLVGQGPAATQPVAMTRSS